MESEKDAAIISRNLVKEFGIGTLVTIMNHHEKEDVRGIINIKWLKNKMKKIFLIYNVIFNQIGYPFGLMEYFTDDCPSKGNPLLLLSDWQVNRIFI